MEYKPERPTHIIHTFITNIQKSNLTVSFSRFTFNRHARGQKIERSVNFHEFLVIFIYQMKNTIHDYWKPEFTLNIKFDNLVT